MTINEYIDRLNSRYSTGISTEHSYRGDLQSLVESLATDVMVTNEPTRVACGAPDYIITKRNIPVGYIEAKDIGKPLDSKDFKEQFDRYRTSLSNLIITDYLEFRLFLDGSFVTSVTIGEIQGNRIIARSAYFAPFSDIIKNFCTHVGQTIKSASKLSKMMAAKARLMANVIEKALTIGDAGNQLNEAQNLNLHNQYYSFKQYLIHDISEKGFADIYAQTIAYGMFAARLNDPTLVDFSRFEAAELIPKSNPFLRNLFQYIAGYDLDDRIKWIIDELADVFRATNVAELLLDFGKSTQQNDPMIHFYETFLAEYDPKLRKSRGVYYTPEPVVNFIVRAVDDILKSEFGLQQGLADTSKVKIKVKDVSKATPDLRSRTKETEREEEVHRVQILDPAAGTGTFLTEVIKQIYLQFEGQQGVWSNYVEEHLIPRLNGFEILMASYAMAHLKLDLLLKETGYVPKKQQRLRVYLTNSLEEHHPDTGTLFAGWLSSEANEANHVKRDTPVMVVLGNPPYSGISTNKGDWITNLIEDYKYVDGVHFGERKHWLQDDYVKFIRLGQYLIEKNGEGILALINNHSFLDNTTFRGMRWSLLNTFDKIYALDLHGNSKKKEISLDGSPDENIFDIMQGVSINIFIKTGKKKINELSKIFHYELLGRREIKYCFLTTKSLEKIINKELKPKKPYLFFVPKNDEGETEYFKGFGIDELFLLKSVGIVTARDKFCIDDNINKLKERINEFADKSVDDVTILKKYNLHDTSTFSLSRSRDNLYRESNLEQYYKRVSYRPFDERWIFYNNYVIERSLMNVLQHFLNGKNIGLLSCRQITINKWDHVGVSNLITDDCRVSNRSKERGYIFPLFINSFSLPKSGSNQGISRISNFNDDIIKAISARMQLLFTVEKEDIKEGFASIDVLDYIYAVLHSPAYRNKYNEFLKINFPRIPYPIDKETFWQLVKHGGELRRIHLFESPLVSNIITAYPVSGSNEVGKIWYYDSKVWINSDQYFDKIPQVSWELWIGGYQPAQKWLKDRKGRTLSFDDIMHYQKIIVALSETDRIMKEIDLINFLE
ncbi:MAG: N-6 DNA methylase [Bacteroidales bacterium]|nr:N-6 DNA methylase [Bacteroidales bacterium]